MRFNPNSETAQYLGDGVYADFDGFQVWVFVHDGLETTSSIALPNDGTFSNLEHYARQYYQLGSGP